MTLTHAPSRPPSLVATHEVAGHTREKWERRLAPAMVALAALAAYHNAFDGVFLLDDSGRIVNNERIRHLWPPWPLLEARRPIVEVSLALNHAVGGLEPWGYHAFNLGVHVLVGLTLLALIRRTLCLAWHDRRKEAANRIALVAAVLWVVHPATTQAVNYLIQRAELLMALFYLLLLYCLARGARAERATPWYLLAIACCALGMASKAVMVTAPLVALVYDRTFLARSWGEMLRSRWWIHGGLVATWSVLLATGIAQGVLNPNTGGAHVGFGYKGISPFEYALTQPGVLLHYASLSFWPAPLCLDYGWPVATTLAAVLPPVSLGLAFLIVMLGMLWHKRAAAFPLLMALLVLLPTSSLVPIRDPLFEHRLYLPLAGFITAAVLGAAVLLNTLVARIAPGRSSVALGATALLLGVTVALIMGTTRRNTDYHSADRMWRDVVAKRPRNPRGYNSLGYEVLTNGEPTTALSLFQTSVRLDPAGAEAQYNLGTTLARLGRTAEAVDAFRTSVRHKPSFMAAHVSLGNALMALGRIDEADRVLREAIAVSPSFAAAHVNLGNILSRRGHLADAAESFHAALAIDPNLADARYNLGNALVALGRTEDAIAAYTENTRRSPNHLPSFRKLAALLMAHNRFDQAIDVLAATARAAPDDAGVRYNLGTALARSGRLSEGAAALREAVRRAPEFVAAWVNLGNTLRLLGRNQEATNAYRAALRIDPSHAGARRGLKELTGGS